MGYPAALGQNHRSSPRTKAFFCAPEAERPRTDARRVRVDRQWETADKDNHPGPNARGDRLATGFGEVESGCRRRFLARAFIFQSGW